MPRRRHALRVLDRIPAALRRDVPRCGPRRPRGRSPGPAACRSRGPWAVPEPGGDAEAGGRDAPDRRSRLLPRAAARAATGPRCLVPGRRRCTRVGLAAGSAAVRGRAAAAERLAAGCRRRGAALGRGLDGNARRGTAGHSTVQVDGLEQNRMVQGRLFALPDLSHARIARLEERDGFEIAAGEHRGYERAGVFHRRIAALRGDCAAFIDELRGHGEHVFHARWFVPHQEVVRRPATEEEKARLQELHGAGLTFGYDVQRCLEVGGRALFAFGATLPWTLDLEATGVSPGYAERRPARCIAVELAGSAPARLFTAVLFLRTP